MPSRTKFNGEAAPAPQEDVEMQDASVAEDVYEELGGQKIRTVRFPLHATGGKGVICARTIW